MKMQQFRRPSDSFIVTLNSTDTNVPTFDCLTDLSPTRDDNSEVQANLVQDLIFPI